MFGDGTKSVVILLHLFECDCSFGDGIVMPSASEPASADLQASLRRAADLLDEDVARAGECARAILEVQPDSDGAQLILASALRRQGKADDALEIAGQLAASNVGSPAVQYEYALCLGAAGQGADAIRVLEQVVALDPGHAAAWRSLGDQLNVAGDEPGSRAAFDRHLQASTTHPELIEAVAALQHGKIAVAERLTRAVLKKDPVDVNAIRMLAGIGLQVGQFDDAIHLLERCLELSPGFQLARQNYVMALSRRQRLDEALVQVDRLLAAEPNNPNYQLQKGAILVQKGEHPEALTLYERFLQNYPRQAGAHLNYGHTLKTVGRVDESISAYRKSIDLRPATGEAYWSLANLKTFRFDDDDIDAMKSALDDNGDADDQSHLLFALGKALEDRKQYEESFGYYLRGNTLRGQQHRHDARINVFNTARQIKSLDAAFFASREGWGCPDPDPIFIVGLPRAGSTLLEQILASHSRVEGTSELPDIIAMSRKLGKRSRKNPAGFYPEILAELDERTARELGESYLASTRVQRHGLPFFIDKMPNNFQHIGLIHLILPNAKIIDARRHPMAGCFSCFKQLFARGQTFTYSLVDLGHYYRDYVKLMDHWDEALPDRVHRVQYEEMVADTENQVRQLLDYCGLEFEEQCLRFYETERAIRTPSSEQVRQPVYTQGLEQWRNFEAHLGPLKDALGPLLARYPVNK